MAQFTPIKKTAQDFNNGVKYIDGYGDDTGDVVRAESINNVIESALYTQEQAENAISIASVASNTANDALTVANGLDGQIKAANITANSANMTSQEAKEIAEEALETVVEGTGTKVSVNGSVVANFDADTKVNKSGDTMTGPLKVPALLASSASNIGQVVPFSMEFYTSPGGDPAKSVDEILKRIKATYPIDRNGTTFFGTVRNSWIGTYMANVYMNEEDSSQAMPQYSSGILIIRGEPGQNSSHQAYLIGTENYIGRCIPLAQLHYVYSPNNPPPTDKLAAYPVGSIYIAATTTSPASLFGGSWSQLLGERYLQTALHAGFLGTYTEAGLPNITGDFGDSQLFISGGSASGTIGNGALRTEASQAGLGVGKYFVNNKITFDASRSNPIYGKSDTVKPKSYCVYMWRRTA